MGRDYHGDNRVGEAPSPSMTGLKTLIIDRLGPTPSEQVDMGVGAHES